MQQEIVHDSNSQIRMQEREDLRLRDGLVSECLQLYFNRTFLIEDRPASASDVGIVREGIVATAPFAHEKSFPSLWEHLIIASIYARRITEKVRLKAGMSSRHLEATNLNPHALEVEGLIHDIGRIPLPHRYLTTDINEQLLLKRMNVRPEVLEDFYSISGVLGISIRGSAVINNVDQMSLVQIIGDVADNLGKRSVDGTFFTVEQFEAYANSQPGRYQGGVWPSERRGRRALTEGGRQKVAINLTLGEMEVLKNEFGIDFEELRAEVADEFFSDEAQAWLLSAKDAQESLDPEYNEKLGRPAISTVVLDIGGVLFQDADPALVSSLADHFHKTKAEILEIFSRKIIPGRNDTLNDLSMRGEISEEEYLREFWQSCGQVCPADINLARAPFINPDIYQPTLGMDEVVEALANNSNVSVYVLSDIIQPLKDVVLDRLHQLYPQLNPSKIVFSCDIAASKKDPSGSAFRKFLTMAGINDPRSAVMVDDVEGNTTHARAVANMRGLTFRGNKFQGLSAKQRVMEELTLGGIVDR